MQQSSVMDKALCNLTDETQIFLMNLIPFPFDTWRDVEKIYLIMNS